MLTALTPTAALRQDLERAGVPLADDDQGGAPGDDLAAWAIVATVLRRLDELPPDERAAHAARAGRALGARGRAPVTGTPARPATVALQRALRRWGSGRGEPRDVVAAARGVVEDMERAGAFSLARTTLMSLLPSAAADGPAAHGLALAHLGRVVRQMGDLDAAIELYEAAAALATTAGDDALAARAAVGMGVIYGQRGNFPASRDAYRRALAVAPPGTPIVAGAHHGLMLAAIAADDLATALAHGWRAFADAERTAERRAEALLNLGSLCRRVGDHAAALRALQACLALAPVPRLRMNALGSAALTAAQSGRPELVPGFVAEADEAVAAISLPWESASVQLEIAEAVAETGDLAGAAKRARAALSLAERHRFFELTWRAEGAIAAYEKAATERAGRPTPAAARTGSRDPGPFETVMGLVRGLPLAAAELLAVH